MLDSLLGESYGHLPNLLALSAAGLVGYVAVVIVYRIFFHPLAKYPGPFLAKVTDLYQFYYAYNKNRHTKVKELHDTYGDYVRYAPNILLVQSNDALKAFYGTKANTGKASFYDITYVNGVSHIVGTIEKPVHARKRRTLAHAFSDQALRGMNKHILAHIDTLCRLLPDEENPQEWGPPRMMSKLLMYMTFDVICDLAYGKENMGQLESPDNRYVLDMLALATYRSNLFGTMTSWAKLGLDKRFFPEIFNGMTKFRAFSKVLAMTRVKLGNDVDRKDFFYHLVNAKDPETGVGLGETELWVESNVLLVAGTDTTAIALSAAYFYLTRYPEVLKKLEEELLSKFSDLQEVTPGPGLSSCQYLRAVVDEAMRLSPSVPGFVPRRALEGGITIGDVHIPEGVEVGTGIYSIHHDERYYSDPNVFQPERWIVSPTNPEEKVKLAQSAYNPFSLGARGCLGKNLAYIELLTTIARSVFQYEMRAAPGSTLGADASGKQFVQDDVFTSNVQGPEVQFRLRRRE